MSNGIKPQHQSPAGSPRSFDLTEDNRTAYKRLISTVLTSEQVERVVEPAEVLPRQKSVLAVHWHPEFVPLDLIRRRIDSTFPNTEDRLIIPTQHNMAMSYDGFVGAEIDCYSPSFRRKVQLLVHLEESRMDNASVFRSMLEHTLRYRAKQLAEFLDTVLEPSLANRFQQAVRNTGADHDLVNFTRSHTATLRQLFLEYEPETPPEMIRNKLLLHYFDSLRSSHDEELIDRAIALLRAVKKVVKANFSNEYFYSTEEVIEEVRGLGGGVVIPHPEQFWPILLADYDVDGYEVWNPQSRDFTDFLIHVVNRQNKTKRYSDRPLLIFMGDDCHMSEKVRDPRYQDPEKAGREVGVQPAWDDLAIRKGLIVAGAGREQVIRDYRERLTG